MGFLIFIFDKTIRKIDKNTIEIIHQQNHNIIFSFEEESKIIEIDIDEDIDENKIEKTFKKIIEATINDDSNKDSIIDLRD